MLLQMGVERGEGGPMDNFRIVTSGKREIGGICRRKGISHFFSSQHDYKIMTSRCYEIPPDMKCGTSGTGTTGNLDLPVFGIFQAETAT
jgi:hypothetical protein